MSSEGNWIRSFDPKEGAYYYYNDITKESYWEEDEEALVDEELDTLSSDNETVHSSFSSDRLSPLSDTVTYPPIRDFRRFMTFHIVVCETPLAILECIVKTPILFIFGVFLQLAAWSSQQPPLQLLAKNWLKESLIMLFSFLSLLFIPGISLYVYKDFDAEEPWQLGFLPTLLGPVDARRFYAFVHGYGEMASQLQLCNTGGSRDSLSTTFVLAPSIVFQQGELVKVVEEYMEEEVEEDEEERKAMAWLRTETSVPSWKTLFTLKQETQPRTLHTVKDVRIALRETIDTYY